jgi:hypothetical protein
MGRERGLTAFPRFGRQDLAHHGPPAFVFCGLLLRGLVRACAWCCSRCSRYAAAAAR